MTLPDDVSISVMDEAQAATLDNWAAEEGWNPGLSDLKIARQCDPDALVALSKCDELAGGGSIMRYDGAFGFMGLFIMRQDLRGQGLGSLLWHWRRDRLLDRLSPGATIGMDGVYDMVPFYERGGFRPAYRHVRYQGTAAGQAHSDVIALGGDDFAEIAPFDRAHFPAPREDFLRLWLTQPGAHVMGIRNGADLAAYGVARPCRKGFKIGPLFAQSDDDAVRLLDTLMAAIAGDQVQIDVPEANPAAVDLVKRFNLSEVFGCVRLYHGPAPTLPVKQIFAVTSLEFG